MSTTQFIARNGFTSKDNSVVSGSLEVTNGITGSLQGTASWAYSASNAINAQTASYLNPLFQTVIITGSIYHSGSLVQTGSIGITGSTVINNLTYPNVDGTFAGQVLQTNATGNLTFGNVETTYDTIYNGEATTLDKGTPVYVSGSQGANPKVYRADASDPNKMPVIYIVSENIATASTGRGITLGHITGIDLTGYNPGTLVYVASGGGWTATRPTGSAIIQFLGLVTKTGNGGQGMVLNPGPATLPNLTTNYVWIGNGGSAPVAVSTSSLYVTNAQTASYAPNYVLNSQTGSFVLNSQTSSFITNSQTSSFITNNQTGSMSVLSSSYSATASYALNAGSTLSGGADGYIPLWSGSNALTSSLLLQTGSILRTDATNNRGIYLDFANDSYYFGNIIGTGNNGFAISSGINQFAASNVTNNLFLVLNAPDKVVKTMDGSSDVGLKLDFTNNQYSLTNGGTFGQTNGLNMDLANNRYSFGHSGFDADPFGLTIESAGIRLGDTSPTYWDTTQYIELTNNKIQTIGGSSGNNGLALDFGPQKTYLFGYYNDLANAENKGININGYDSLHPVVIIGDNQYDNPGHQTKLTVDDVNQSIVTSNNGNDIGLGLYFGNNVYYLGDFNNIVSGSQIVIDDINRTVNVTGSLNATGSSHLLKAGNIVVGINDISFSPNTFGVANAVGGDNLIYIDTTLGSEQAYIGNTNQSIGIIGSTIRVGRDDTANVFLDAIANNIQITGSLNAQSITGSLQGTASWATNFISASNYVLNSQTSSFVQNSQTSSFVTNSQTSSFVKNSQTSSFALLASNNTFTGKQYISDTTNPTNFTSTASLYTDGGLRVTKDAYVSGTLYVNNLTVYGTQSVLNITSSQLNIATNLITVNTATPAVRFGGLAVIDSGSSGTGLTGSILWDSLNNTWIYSNPSGSSYDGAMILVGPRNSTGIGNEVGITTNYLAKGDGSHHMTASMIFDDGTIVSLGRNTQITGSLNVSNGITGSLQGLKAGSGSIASFGGSPLTASFTFTNPYANNNYAVTVTGEDARIWTIQSKTATGFTINSNSTTALTGPVYWIANSFGT